LLEGACGAAEGLGPLDFEADVDVIEWLNGDSAGLGLQPARILAPGLVQPAADRCLRS
jgi:hypothetical protein